MFRPVLLVLGISAFSLAGAIQLEIQYNTNLQDLEENGGDKQSVHFIQSQPSGGICVHLPSDQPCQRKIKSPPSMSFPYKYLFGLPIPLNLLLRGFNPITNRIISDRVQLEKDPSVTVSKLGYISERIPARRYYDKRIKPQKYTSNQKIGNLLSDLFRMPLNFIDKLSQKKKQSTVGSNKMTLPDDVATSAIELEITENKVSNLRESQSDRAFTFANVDERIKTNVLNGKRNPKVQRVSVRGKIVTKGHISADSSKPSVIFIEFIPTHAIFSVTHKNQPTQNIEKDITPKSTKCHEILWDGQSPLVIEIPSKSKNNAHHYNDKTTENVNRKTTQRGKYKIFWDDLSKIKINISVQSLTKPVSIIYVNGNPFQIHIKTFDSNDIKNINKNSNLNSVMCDNCTEVEEQGAETTHDTTMATETVTTDSSLLSNSKEISALTEKIQKIAKTFFSSLFELFSAGYTKSQNPKLEEETTKSIEPMIDNIKLSSTGFETDLSEESSQIHKLTDDEAISTTDITQYASLESEESPLANEKEPKNPIINVITKLKTNVKALFLLNKLKQMVLNLF